MAGGVHEIRNTRTRKSSTYLIGIVVGIATIILSTAGIMYRSRVLSFEHVPVAYTVEQGVQRDLPPGSISIPSINVATAIVPGRESDGVWSIPKNAVAHLITSARPGEKGNIVIYGHNKRNILQRLPKIQVGDVITITDTAGVPHRYAVNSVQVVSPAEVDILNQNKTEQLTLYTCTGLFDQDRFVATAVPVDV